MTTHHSNRSFWIGAFLCLALAMFGVAVCHSEGITYTHDQVMALIQERGVPWAADWIMNVYNATPIAISPSAAAVLTGSDLGVSLQGPVDVSIADRLKYHLSIGPWEFKGVVPHIDTWALVRAGGIGFVAGVAVTILVEIFTGHLK